MPAYNAEKYLREAIDSIICQTFTDFEFIIINDGSTDTTEQIIKSYSDPRIIYLKNDVNSGICVTLNKGLNAARGKYIARMDSDDISLPERLAVQVAFMDEHPEIAVCGSDFEVFGETVHPYVNYMIYDPTQCRAGLIFSSCFAHPSVIIRTAIIKDDHLHYENDFKGLEDYKLWWEITKHGKPANIDRPLLRYRIHRGQETQNVSSAVRSKLNEFVKTRLKYLNVSCTSTELSAFTKYCNGNYGKFGEPELIAFSSICKSIIKSKKWNKEERIAVKLTVGKAVSYILDQSGFDNKSKKRLTRMALFKGIMPLIWFIKVSYHQYFK